MKKRILGGTLVVLSIMMLVLSLTGVGAIAFYNQPFTDDLLGKLNKVNDELLMAQESLGNAQQELQRALRIVENAEEALQDLSKQREQAKGFLDAVDSMLTETIIPNIEGSKEKIADAKKTFDDIRTTIINLNRIPFIEIEVPDEGLLTYFEEIIVSLETEVDNVGEMAEEASLFLNDTSYLLGGDLAETKENIYNLADVIEEYEQKVRIWQAQAEVLIAETPRRVDLASALFAIFLLWVAFSQAGLVLHGISLWQEATQPKPPEPSED